jgi:hypothetical protein
MLIQRIVVMVLLGILALPSVADEITGNEIQSGQDRDELVRAKYQNGQDLPDGIAFTHLLRVLSSQEHQIASYILQDGLEIDSPTSDQLLSAMLTTIVELEAEIRDEILSIGCIGNVPRLYGDEVYGLLEAIDDAEENVGLKKLLEFRNEIGPELSTKLMRWISEEKSNISSIQYDPKKVHQQAGRTGDATLAEICVSLSNTNNAQLYGEEHQND